MADTAPDANGGSILETTKANAVASVKDQTAKTSSELSNLAASRRTPETATATGQPLTHYHSFFHELLSWNNPRASAIALVSIISLIITFQVVDVFRYVLKLAWMALGITVTAEALGKFVLNNGLATQIRPRRYYTVSRATIDSLVGDAQELINFIVIEAQRLIFVESVPASLAAAVFAFFSYFLTAFVPYWGFAIIGTIVAFIAPLIYVNNKELIDHHLKNAGDTIEAQGAQVRSVAQKQAGQVATIGKQYAGDYTAKVQEMLRGHGGPPKNAVVQKQPNFPTAPTEEPAAKPAEVEIPSVPDEPIGTAQEPHVAS